MAEHTKKIHFMSNSTEETAQLYTSRDDVTPIDGNGQLVSDYPAMCVQDGNDTVYAGLVDPLDALASDLHCTHDNTEYAVAEINLASFSPVLKENSIEQIQYAAQHDLAGLLWSIGDYFETTLNGTFCGNNYSNFVVRCVLFGINHNATKEGDHRLHFLIGKNTKDSDIGFPGGQMNTSRTNSGGWNGSYMKSTVLPSFKNLLPADLQNAIKSVTKYTDNAGLSDSASNVTATNESGLWLLSELEVWGSCTHSNGSERGNQARYNYFWAAAGVGVNRINALTSQVADVWWFRSPATGSSNSGYKTECFCGYVFTAATNKSPSFDYANNVKFVVPCFCL